MRRSRAAARLRCRRTRGARATSRCSRARSLARSTSSRSRPIRSATSTRSGRSPSAARWAISISATPTSRGGRAIPSSPPGTRRSRSCRRSPRRCRSAEEQTMPARTGEQFLNGLRKPRAVWVDGERVSDVVSHPKLCGAAHALAEIFDLQHVEKATCLTPDPETGEAIAVSHMIPKSREDLAKRGRALRTVAEFSVGLMGRTPDYMNVTYAGFAGRCDEWAANGNEEGAANLVEFQKELRRRDLSLTHTLIHATVEKSKGHVPSGFDDTQLHKVEDTAHGIL